MKSQIVERSVNAMVLLGGMTMPVLSVVLLTALAVAAADPPDPDAGRPATSESRSLNLEEAIAMAIESNPALRVYDGQIEAAAGRARQAGVWTNPDLTLNAEEWPVSGGGGFGDAKQTIGVEQTIPFPGKMTLDRRIGSSGIRHSEAEWSLRRSELIREVKSAFFRVLAAERLVAVAEELVQVAESSAATARKRVAAGAAADQEQLRAEIPLEQARTELSGFRRELEVARHALVRLLGRPDLLETPVSGSLEGTENLALLERGPDQWLADHPSVAVAGASRSRAELEVRRARLEPYPDVRFGVAGGRLGETGQSIIELGVALPLPIIDTSKGRRQEALAGLRMAEANQAAVEQGLWHEWRAASSRFRTALDQVRDYRNAILPRATEAQRLVQIGFEQGKFDFIDLLDTQRTAAEVRLAYQQKLLELNLAQAELEYLTTAGSAPARDRQTSRQTTE